MTPGTGPSESELERQREVIRRSLLRANTAVVVVLLAVLALAAAAVLFSHRAAQQRRAAEQQQRRAEAAEAHGREQVYRSSLAQARAERLSGQGGARLASLAAISNAAAIRPSVDLRREAIAALSLPDAETESLHTLTGYSRVRDFSPALNLLVAGDNAGRFTVYRMSDFIELYRFDLQGSRIMRGLILREGRFSPDGRYYAAVAREGFAVWDLQERRLVFDHGAGSPGSVSEVTFTPDSRYVAFHTTWHNSDVLFFELANARERKHKARIGNNPFAFHPRDPLVAVALTNEVRVLDYDTGEQVRSLTAPGHSRFLSWSPDGGLLLGGKGNGDVWMWNLELDEFHILSGHTEVVNMIGVSERDDLIVSASRDGTTRLWDAATARPVLTMFGQALAFDGRARIGFEVDRSRVGIWRIQRPPGLRTFTARGPRGFDILCADLSPSGRWLAALVSGGVQMWDLDATNLTHYFALTNASGLAFHPDERSLFLCVNGVLAKVPVGVASTSTNATVQLPAGEFIDLPTNSYAHQVAVDADGKTLAVELADFRVLALDLVGTRPAKLLNRQSTTRNYLGWSTPTGSGRMALSADGRWICAGYGFTNRPVVMDTATGDLVTELGLRAGGAAFSPDGCWLATTGNNSYDFWKVGSWERERSIVRETLLGRRGLIAFAPKVHRLAVTRDPQSIDLLDTETFSELGTWSTPQAQSIACLRLAADGRRLVATTANNLVQVWELPVFQSQLATLGLDWGHENGATMAMAASRPTASVGPATTIAFGLITVGLAGFFSLFVLRRHRRLVEDFVQTEATAVQHHRELDAAKMELMHSQKMKALGTLAAGIAHDFNNLLSVIRMSNKLIGRAAKGNADVAEEVVNIEEAVQQGKNVVRSMLGYSRERPDDSGTCDLDEVVEETVSLLSKEFLSGIELTLALDRDLPAAQVGRGRVEQILLNLIVNASEAMRAEGKLTISVHRCEDGDSGKFILRPRSAARHVQLVVSDSGPGIAPEIMPRIFEPFFTTKTTGSKQGTGLGLSMVYTVAEQEGLGISVESTIGQGATFRLILPACAPEAQFQSGPPCDNRKA